MNSWSTISSELAQSLGHLLQGQGLLSVVHGDVRLANLERVLPEVALRQWVLTFPFRVAQAARDGRGAARRIDAHLRPSVHALYAERAGACGGNSPKRKVDAG